ncbi:MAG: 2OG-Fe(II) oxygenase [Woeseia sp.]
MDESWIEVPYNYDLKPLQDVLARIRRPGDFFVKGSLEAPMPRVEVDGVGVLSFPLPSAQARDVIARCERAPYGRGAETIVDTSVRKVWQLAPAKVAVGGKSWPRTFRQILATATEGLGCGGADVAAELYKLLLYDEGAFFKAHRDTEKADGMFGTLLIVLPSPHTGSELVLRHAGREVTLDLSDGDVSELRFAAFYADCEHEVLPVREGNRLCLVYNLVQKRKRKARKSAALAAPIYDAETAAAAELLEKAFADDDAPLKLGWLLEHQYSPAGLAFSALKNADAALAKVLRAAVERADCAFHLGLVHIEEYGPAELSGDHLEPYYGWRGYDDEGFEDDLASSDDYEVVEVSDGWSYVDHWMDAGDNAAGFGRIPLRDGEVLPAGGLDGELPDDERVMEASGNEGASFERAYHRAAFVIWPRSRSVDVLLQAGMHAALPWLEQRLASGDGRQTGSDRVVLCAEARRVLEAWERDVERESRAFADYGNLDFDDEDREDDVNDRDDAVDDREDGAEDRDDTTDDAILFGPDEAERADRGRMAAVLGQLGDAALLERFIRRVVTPQFDGSEAEALAVAARILDAGRWSEVFSSLVQQNMVTAPRGCISLFVRLIHSRHAPPGQAMRGKAPGARARGESGSGHAERTTALRAVGAAVVTGLPRLGDAAARADVRRSSGTTGVGAVDAEALADLLDGLAVLEAAPLREAACEAVTTNARAFDARTVIAPALCILCERGRDVAGDAGIERLWLHAADSLLAASEYPPAPPGDWRQSFDLACDCGDCRALAAFAGDPADHVRRFPLRKDRRQHLHRQIDQHRLDMTHVTERKGRPYTLVCTKTRWSYERRCRIYRQEIAALELLAGLAGHRPPFDASRTRIAAALERASGKKGRVSGR